MVDRFIETGIENENGATTVGYAVVLMLIAAVIIFSVSLVGEDTRKAYEKVNTVPVENAAVIGND
jgi:Flp pilus assembly pilin Flp